MLKTKINIQIQLFTYLLTRIFHEAGAVTHTGHIIFRSGTREYPEIGSGPSVSAAQILRYNMSTRM